MRNLPAVLPGSPFTVERLLAPEDAVAAYLAAADLATPEVEYVSLDDAWDRVLGAAVAAAEAYPTHRRSTMDGYAVRAQDDGPRRILAEIRMGEAPAAALVAGDAAPIPTGGALPSGANAVVPLEDATIVEGLLHVASAVEAGAFVTQPGDDMQAGDQLLGTGRRIGGPELGVLATLGVVRVPVYRRPRIAVISTGDELVPPESALRVGIVRDSNRYAVAGALRGMGAVPVQRPHVRDDASALGAAVRGALAECDGVVLTGGSSVGERDLVPRVVATLGSPGIIVHGLRVKPGKPTMLAAIDGKPVIGLPGNPTSSLAILEAVVRPILRARTGEIDRGANAIAAVAAEPIVGRAGWTWFVPVRLSRSAAGFDAWPLVLRSASTSLLARASGYVTIAPNAPCVDAGTPVRVVLFSSGGAPVEAGR